MGHWPDRIKGNRLCHVHTSQATFLVKENMALEHVWLLKTEEQSSTVVEKLAVKD